MEITADVLFTVSVWVVGLLLAVLSGVRPNGTKIIAVLWYLLLLIFAVYFVYGVYVSYHNGSLPYLTLYMLLIAVSHFCTYANEKGWFTAFHPWARKVSSKAYSFVSCCDGSPDIIYKDISQYLEARWYGDSSQRRETKHFYFDEVKILFMLLYISYDALLFSSFEGTGKEISPKTYRTYASIFKTAASELSDRGYKLDIDAAFSNFQLTCAFSSSLSEWNPYI